MDEPETYWSGVARFLWPALVGLGLAALLSRWSGMQAVWTAVAGLALIALFVSYLAREGRLFLREQRVERGTARESFLTPLAREVLGQLPDPLMLLDEGGRVLFANSAMHAVIGVGPEKRHISLLLRTPAVLSAIEQTSASGEAASFEFTVPVPVMRTYQAHVARMNSQPPVTTLLLHDLTASKRTEQMRADFVANASHELRTPLAAVSGFIDTLRGHARDDGVARERFLDIMSVEAGRMRRLIEDLLSLTRIELNEHLRPSGAVSLGAIIAEATAALSPLALSDGITLEVSATPDLPAVTGERDELIQLFQNLIHNAIKYGRSGGHVWITLSEAPGQGARGTSTMVSVGVRDDGEGIAPDAIPRLTERFYRVDVKRSREKGGTGLGLSIARQIIYAHGGVISIDDPAEHAQGAVFVVRLPLEGSPRS